MATKKVSSSDETEAGKSEAAQSKKVASQHELHNHEHHDHEGCCHEYLKTVELEPATDDELIDLADFYKVFGDYTRLRLVQQLIAGEKCVGELANALNMEQSAISHQLKIIKQMKLVRARRDGKQMMYSLADAHIKLILTMGLEHIREK